MRPKKHLIKYIKLFKIKTIVTNKEPSQKAKLSFYWSIFVPTLPSGQVHQYE